MTRRTTLLVGLGCLLLGCSEAGTLVPQEAGPSDAEQVHDVVFVDQVDNDADAEEPVEAGPEGDADAGTAGEEAGEADAVLEQGRRGDVRLREPPHPHARPARRHAPRDRRRQPG